MAQDKEFMGLRAEQIQKIVQSTQAQQLLKKLNQNGGQTLKMASDAAKKGDYDAVKKLIEPMLKDEKTAALLEQLTKKQG